MDRENFWDMVDKSAGPNACWPWKGSVSHKYGKVYIEGKNHQAHRAAFYLANGHWPEPCCCHVCDNPPCCNPLHLWEGTQAENMDDMRSKGHGYAKKPRKPPTPLAVARKRKREAKEAKNLARFGMAKLPGRASRWNVFC